MSDYMRQCALRKCFEDGGSGGTAHTVSWLPGCYAQRGKLLDLRRDDGTWDHGWTVAFVYEPRMPARDVHERSRDHLKQRKASDI